jgi:AAA domain/DnaB-like helicase N terminal domain
MPQNITDHVVYSERSVLGCLVEFCSRGSAKELDGVIASGVAADQFTTNDHRAIFRTMVEVRSEGKIPDEPSLTQKLDDRLMAQVWDLIKGVVPENLECCVRNLRTAWQDLRFSKQIEELANLTSREDPLALLGRMRETLLGTTGADNWRSIFHTWEECENAPPLRFAIDGFLQESGVTLIGSLAGHGKTLLMLAMVKALLEESPLFSHEPFSVPQPATRICYLIPESSIGPFWSRIKMFGLEQFVREDRLLIRTIQAREQVELTDPRMLAAVEGADVFLDSVVRFTVGSENDAENARLFSDVLFRLLRSGARSITGCQRCGCPRCCLSKVANWAAQGQRTIARPKHALPHRLFLSLGVGKIPAYLCGSFRIVWARSSSAISRKNALRSSSRSTWTRTSLSS